MAIVKSEKYSIIFTTKIFTKATRQNSYGCVTKVYTVVTKDIDNTRGFNMSKNSDIKNAVRKTREWKEFRQNLIEKQKVSFISGKKLLSGANCHHLDLNVEHYGVFDEEHQVMLNRKDHELIHAVYGDERHKKDWKKIIERLTLLCTMMDKFNK